MVDHIFLIIPIKYLINKDGESIKPFKLATDTKPSMSHLCVLFFSCVVQKSTAHVGTKSLNMRHQAQKDFLGIFVEIPQHQRGYFVFVPHKCKIISLYDFIFDDSLYSPVVYMSQLYPEAMCENTQDPDD